MPGPTRDTTAGRIYNDLRNLARRADAPTDQVMLEYLLERFLYRVSIHPLGRQHFVFSPPPSPSATSTPGTATTPTSNSSSPATTSTATS
ncbi:MAG: hypothetical protein ACRDNZ_07360 [Streptosporangiaceae bacterium]